MLLLTVLSPNDCFISFTQTHKECELKIIEQEKEVTVLPPKDACKCHKEDLAKALNVRVFTHLPAWGGETSPGRDVWWWQNRPLCPGPARASPQPQHGWSRRDGGTLGLGKETPITQSSLGFGPGKRNNLML